MCTAATRLPGDRYGDHPEIVGGDVGDLLGLGPFELLDRQQARLGIGFLTFDQGERHRLKV